MRTTWLLMGVAAFAMSFVAACGGDSDDDTPNPDSTATEELAGDGAIEVRLFEWTVDASEQSAPAGDVTLNARNIGGANHDLVIVRTELAPDALPVDDEGIVQLKDADVLEVAGEIEEFGPGLERTATFELTPGDYVLICSVVDISESGTTSHYLLGMTAAFQVTE